MYRLFRQVCPHLPFDIRESGTDVCEGKFSELGGFGGIEAGRRNFNVGEAIAGAQKQNTVTSWEGDRKKGGLERTRRHLKQEHHVLDGDEDKWDEPTDLKLYLEDRDIVHVLRLVGMRRTCYFWVSLLPMPRSQTCLIMLP